MIDPRKDSLANRMRQMASGDMQAEMPQLTPEQPRSTQALWDKWNVKKEQYENSGMGKWSGRSWQPNDFESQLMRSNLRRAMGLPPEVSSKSKPERAQKPVPDPYVNDTFQYSDR